MALVFEWDPSKAALNRRKHGVSFEDAATVFADPLSLTVVDSRFENAAEIRFVTIGSSLRGLPLVVAHCDRGIASES